MDSKNLYEIAVKKVEKDRLRFMTLLVSIKEPELRLIKGHLLIEEVLSESLDYRMRKKASLEKARLTFAQKLSIVEGLYYQKETYPEWLTAATSKLNKLRNRLAHNVEPANINSEINEFCKFVLNNIRKGGEPPTDSLLYALGNIHSSYLFMLQVYKEMQTIPPSMKAMSFKTKLMAYQAGMTS